MVKLSLFLKLVYEPHNSYRALKAIVYDVASGEVIQPAQEIFQSNYFGTFNSFIEPSEDGLFYIGSTGDEGSSDFTLFTFNPSTGFVDEISNQTEFMSKIIIGTRLAAQSHL